MSQHNFPQVCGNSGPICHPPKCEPMTPGMSPPGYPPMCKPHPVMCVHCCTSKMNQKVEEKVRNFSFKLCKSC